MSSNIPKIFKTSTTQPALQNILGSEKDLTAVDGTLDQLKNLAKKAGIDISTVSDVESAKEAISKVFSVKTFKAVLDKDNIKLLKDLAVKSGIADSLFPGGTSIISAADETGLLDTGIDKVNDISNYGIPQSNDSVNLSGLYPNAFSGNVITNNISEMDDFISITDNGKPKTSEVLSIIASKKNSSLYSLSSFEQLQNAFTLKDGATLLSTVAKHMVNGDTVTVKDETYKYSDIFKDIPSDIVPDFTKIKDSKVSEGLVNKLTNIAVNKEQLEVYASTNNKFTDARDTIEVLNDNVLAATYKESLLVERTNVSLITNLNTNSYTTINNMLSDTDIKNRLDSITTKIVKGSIQTIANKGNSDVFTSMTNFVGKQNISGFTDKLKSLIVNTPNTDESHTKLSTNMTAMGVTPIDLFKKNASGLATPVEAYDANAVGQINNDNSKFIDGVLTNSDIRKRIVASVNYIN